MQGVNIYRAHMSTAKTKVASYLQRLIATLRKPFLPERRLYRWGRSLKNIVDDYATVTKDTATSLRQRPFRLLSLVAGVGTFTAMWRKNPDMDSYLEELLAYSNEISQCSELTRNLAAKRYIERLLLLKCHGLLSYVNLGILSFVVERRKIEDCSNYAVSCRHLQPRWWSLPHWIVDVGVWGKWRVMEKEMVNFDVNEESLKDLIS